MIGSAEAITDTRIARTKSLSGGISGLLIEALRRSKEWLAAYYDALARFVGGEREVEFPRGTWQMCARLQCPAANA